MYPQVSLFIDGGWTKGSGGRTIPVLNPATAEEIGTVAHAETSDLEHAVHAADKAFKTWRKVPAFDRKFYEAVRRDRPESGGVRKRRRLPGTFRARDNTA